MTGHTPWRDIKHKGAQTPGGGSMNDKIQEAKQAAIDARTYAEASARNAERAEALLREAQAEAEAVPPKLDDHQRRALAKALRARAALNVQLGLGLTAQDLRTAAQNLDAGAHVHIASKLVATYAKDTLAILDEYGLGTPAELACAIAAWEAGAR
jgi:hypothetical protein